MAALVVVAAAATSKVAAVAGENRLTARVLLLEKSLTASRRDTRCYSGSLRAPGYFLFLSFRFPSTAVGTPALTVDFGSC